MSRRLQAYQHVHRAIMPEHAANVSRCTLDDVENDTPIVFDIANYDFAISFDLGRLVSSLGG